MVLIAVAFLSAKAAIGPCTGIAGGQGDPHLYLYSAHGGHADFRGEDKAFFNFLSHEKISANIKTEDGVFRLHNATVDGSWMTEVHVAAKTPAGQLYWTYAAARISPASLLGFSNGTCGGVHFKLTGSRMGNLRRDGPLQRQVCGDVVLQVRLA